jgi:hypothetical protein
VFNNLIWNDVNLEIIDYRVDAGKFQKITESTNTITHLVEMYRSYPVEVDIKIFPRHNKSF